MKMLIQSQLIAAFIFVLCAGTLAQDQYVKSADKRGERLAQHLDLHGDQKTEVLQIMKNYKADLRDVARTHENVQDRQQAAKALKEEMHKDMGKILDEGQYRKFIDMESTMEMKLKHRRERREVEIQQRSKDLNLTETQQEQLRAINIKARAKRLEIRNQELSSADRRVALQDLKKEIDLQVAEILDDEQYTQWKDNQAKRQQQMKESRRMRPSSY